MKIHGLILRDRTGKVLLKVPSLECDPKQGVAVLGHSGAGKTLLLRAIANSLPRGIESCGGARSREWDDVNREHCVTMVPQVSASVLPPLIGVADFVSRVIAWNSSGEDRPSQDESLRLLDLVGYGMASSLAQLRAFELSGGMAKRVALAAALATKPSLLLLDEPTSGLDPIAVREWQKLFAYFLNPMGIGLLISTHDVRLALETCGQLVVIRSGEILFSGTADDLKAIRDDYVRRLLDRGILSGPRKGDA